MTTALKNAAPKTILTLAVAALVAALVAGVAAAPAAAAPAAAGGLDGLIPAGVTVSIGAAATYEPKYEGSKSYELSAIPIIKFRSANGEVPGLFGKVDFRSIDDIGFGLLNVGGLSVGPAVGYRFDREEDDGAKLRGLGNVDGAFLAGGFARYDFKPVYVRASYLTEVIGDDNTGGLFRLQVGADYMASRQLLLKPFAAIEWADDDYMQTYFGVTAAQSARSGLKAYSASAGAKSFHIGAGAEYELFPTWTLHAGVEYVRLLGDAADSPIVEEENQVRARLGLAKTFSLGQ